MSDALPKGWAEITLQDAGAWRTGGTPSRRNPEFFGKGIPWVKSGDLPDGPIVETQQEITKLGLENSAARLMPAGTISMALYGATIGKLGVMTFPAATNQACANVIPDTRLVEPRFLFNYLLSERQNFMEQGQGGAQPNISQGIVRNHPFPLAPLAEQRRIVAKLETLLGKVDASQQRLAKTPVLLKRFRQSVLAAACSGRLTADWREENPTDDAARDTDLPHSWKSVEFGELVSDGPQNGLYKPASFYGDGTLIVRIDAFYDGTIAAWDELKRVRLSEKERNQFALRNDDILVNRVNSPKFLGKCALVRKLKEPCVYESNMMRLRLDTSRSLPDYAILYLQSLPGLVELRKNAKHAVNQSSINQEDVKAALFNLPPLPEQQEIVRRVEGLFALADQLEERLAKARGQVDQLTPSLLARAFAGQIVPQDPTDEPAEKLLERIREQSESKSHRDARK